jgi:8-oxo-dGTP pyrophosphatase MutT (NUDIX family)
MVANSRSIPAASSLVVRSPPGGVGQVLLVRRAAGSRSFGDFWVFPGGKLDDADRQAAELLAQDRGAAASIQLTQDLWTHGAAAWRELLEETCGPTSQAHEPRCLAQALGGMISWSHWHAPRTAPAPFDTRFVLLDAAALPHEPRPDGAELTDLQWLAPGQALRKFEAGHIQLSPPTRFNLLELDLALREVRSVDELLARERARPIIRIRPRIRRIGDETYTIFPWDPGFDDGPPDELPGDPTGEIPPRYLALPSRFTVRR